MATALQKETNSGMTTCSVQKIARLLDLPVSTVHKNLHNILHPYKITHILELLPALLPVRRTLALEFLAYNSGQ